MHEAKFTYTWVVQALTLVFSSYTVGENSSVDELDDALRSAALEVYSLRQVHSLLLTPYYLLLTTCYLLLTTYYSLLTADCTRCAGACYLLLTADCTRCARCVMLTTYC